jgi:hypothetical protein
MPGKSDDHPRPGAATRRWRLLQSCSLSIGLVAAGVPQRLRAQAFQGTPTVTSGTLTIDRTATGVDRITTSSATAIIDWNPTNQAGSGTIAFLPQGNTARYDSTPAIGANYVILNRINPAATTRPISFSGTVQSFAGGTSAPGGALWFYSPGGIILTPTASFNIGSLLLTADPVSIGTGNLLFSASGQIQLRPGPTPSAAVTIMPGATITASPGASYVALVAPVVNQDGMINVNGAAALVAAESVDLTYNAGLFDIQVNSGSGAGGTILEHSGTTSGPASTGAADPRRIYLVAISKGNAFSMLLSGTIGFQAASSASIVNGEVILASGRNIAGGDPPANPGTLGAAAGVSISNAAITSPINLFASSAVAIASSGVVPIARIDAPSDVTINTDGVSGNGGINSGGTINITGSVSADSLALGALSAANKLTISGAGGVTLTSATSGDDLAISAKNLNVQQLTTTYKNGDPNNNGAPISVATTGGALTIGNAESHDVLTLAATGGPINATSLKTDSGALVIGSTDLELITVDTINAAGNFTVNAMGGEIDAHAITTAAGSVSLTGGVLSLTTINSAGDVTLAGTGAVTASDLVVANKLGISTSGGLTLTSATSGDDMTISAKTLNVQQLTTTYKNGDPNNNGAPISVTATGGGLTIGNAESHDVLTLAATGGPINATSLKTDSGALVIGSTDLEHITVDTINAAGNFTVNAMGGEIDAHAITTAAGSVSLTGGVLSLTTINSAGDVTLAGTGAVTASDLVVANKLGITTPGVLTLTSATSGDDMTITAQSLNAQLLTTTYKNGDPNNNGAPISVATTGGNLALTSINSHDALSLSATGGTIDLASITTLSGTTSITAANQNINLNQIAASGNLTIDAGTGTVTAVNLAASLGIISVNGGQLALQAITAASDLNLTSPGAIGGTTIAAGHKLNINAGGALTLDTATAGDNVVISAQSLTAKSLTATYQNGDPNNDGAPISVTTTNGDLKLTSAEAHDALVLSATGGAIIADTLKSDNGAATLTTKGTMITLNQLTAASNITVDAGAGTVGATNVATTSGNISVNGGQLTLQAITAASDLDLTSPGVIGVTNIAAGHKLNITAGGALTLDTATAGDNIVISAQSVTAKSLTATYQNGDPNNDGAPISVTTTDGDLKLTSAEAHDALALSATGGVIVADTLKSDNGAATLTTKGTMITLNQLTAASNITVDAGAGTVGATKVASTLGIISVNGGQLALQAITAASDLDLTSPGMIGVTNIAAGHKLNITAGGALTLDTATAGDNVVISAQSLTAKTLTATYQNGDPNNDGAPISVTTTNGDLTLMGAEAHDALTLSATGGAISADALKSDNGSATISAAGSKAIKLGTLSSANNLTVTAQGSGEIDTTSLTTSNGVISLNGGVLALGTITSGNDLNLTGSGNISATSLSAVHKLNVAGQQDVAIQTATSGDDMRISGATAELQKLTTTYLNGDPDNNGAPITVSTSSGDLMLTNAEAHDALSLFATGGAVVATTLKSDNGSTDVSTAGGKAIKLGTLSTANNLTITAQGGGEIDATSLSTNTGVTTLSGGVLALGMVTSGSDLNLTGSGNISATSLSAVHKLNVAGQQDVALQTAISGDDMNISGNTAELQQLTTTYQNGDPNNNGAPITVTTVGDLTVGAANAHDVLTLTSQNGNLTAANFSGSELNFSGASIALTASGALQLNSLNTTGNLAVTAGGDLTINSATAGGTIDFTSQTGNLTTGQVKTPGAAVLQAARLLHLSGALRGGPTALSSADIQIDAGASLTAPTATITSTSKIGATIGGTGGGSGYTLSADEFSRIHTGALTVAAAYNGSAAPDLTIGDLTAIGSRAGTASDGSAIGTISGPAAALIFTTPGSISVTGHLTLANAGSTDRLELDAGRTLAVTTPAGGIKLVDANMALTGTLALAGNEVISASAQAMTDLSAPTTIIERGTRLATNDGAVVPEGYIQAGTISVAAGSALDIQNSGNTTPNGSAGFSAGLGGVSVASSSGNPIEIIVNGRIANASGSYDTGAAALPRINFIPIAGTALYVANSTVNGCVIGQTGCAAPAPPPPPPPPSMQEQVVETALVEIAQNVENHVNRAGIVVNPLQPELIDPPIVFVTGFASSDIIDESILGFGGDVPATQKRKKSPE